MITKIPDTRLKKFRSVGIIEKDMADRCKKKTIIIKYYYILSEWARYFSRLSPIGLEFIYLYQNEAIIKNRILGFLYHSTFVPLNSHVSYMRWLFVDVFWEPQSYNMGIDSSTIKSITARYLFELHNSLAAELFLIDISDNNINT